MIILDKRSYSLLYYVVHSYEPETIMVISKKIGQSRRKIYYHLDRINDALPNDVDAIVSYPRIGIVLNDEQREACKVLLAELGDYSYIMSVEERIQLSLTCIAVSKDKVTIEKLMQLNDVSRNTILNDLGNIRDYLSKDDYDIQLRVNKAQGYLLSCHPLSKIQFLYHLLYSIYSQGNKSFIAIIRERIIDLTGFGQYFSKEINRYLQDQLSSAQESLGKKINSQDGQFMIQILPYLILSYRNLDLSSDELEAVMRDFSMTWKRQEYQLACSIADGLQKQFDMALDKIEISLIAMLLLSFRKDRDFHLESRDFDDMRQVLSRFLLEITKQYGLNFVHRDDLLNQLLSHCKALLYRKTYGVLSVNPLAKYIAERYPDLFAITKSCSYLLEEAWLLQLTDDDIAYLVIHLRGELEREGLTKIDKKQVIIICNEGIGVQKLLMSQCQDYLPNCVIEAVFTSEQFYSVSDIVEDNMIISTSDALETSLPFIIVHPILTDEDIIKILRFSKNNGKTVESHFSKKLEKCLQVYVPDANERYVLLAQIEKLVGQELSETEACQSRVTKKQN